MLKHHAMRHAMRPANPQSHCGDQGLRIGRGMGVDCTCSYTLPQSDIRQDHSAKQIRSDSEDEWPDRIVPMIGSNVTDLNISQGDLEPRRLMPLLQSFDWLQSFTYRPAENPQQRYDFDAFSLVTYLLACARD